MIDKNKTYRTRDGREVRIYATDCGSSEPVHGAVRDWTEWVSCSWNSNGQYISHKTTDNDLIEVKPRIKREVWLNVFNNGNVIVSETPKYVDITHRIACVKVVIDCEEGEGL